jgi:hypothetical protein
MVAATVNPARDGDILSDQALINLSAIVAAHGGIRVKRRRHGKG